MTHARAMRLTTTAIGMFSIVCFAAAIWCAHGWRWAGTGGLAALVTLTFAGATHLENPDR